MVAAEASGDQLGAELIDAIRARAPETVFAGVGGPAMQERGVKSAIDIGGLAILGLIDGVKAYPRVVRLADATADAAEQFAPDTAVLIDSWGFTLRVAKRLRARMPGVRLVKYVGPQVWASRPGRAKTLSATVDHLVCIHDFETPFYAEFGLPCTVCGHPALGRYRQGDGAAFRDRHGLGDRPVLLLLPGSRRSELRRTGPVLAAAAKRIVAAHPELKVVMVAARPVASLVNILADESGLDPLVIDEAAGKEDVFAAATAALATSGTVTTEVGLQETPVVVGYRLGWVTWALARLLLYKAPFATLMNVAAGREVAPEFIQTRCTPENLAEALTPLLFDAGARAAQVAAQDRALATMGRGARPAAEIAADAVLSVSSAG